MAKDPTVKEAKAKEKMVKRHLSAVSFSVAVNHVRFPDKMH